MFSNILNNQQDLNIIKTEKNIQDVYFKDYLKAIKKLSINKQIHNNITKIVTKKETKTFLEKYFKDSKLKKKIMVMPKIKISQSSKANRI